MSLLSPLGSIDSHRPSSSLKTSLVLLIGVVLGGGIGFYLGRTSAPEPAPCPAAAEEEAAPDASPADAQAAAPGDDMAAGLPDAAPPAPPGDAAPAPAGQQSLDATISGSLYATLSRQLEGREADILSAHIGRLLVWWLDARRDVLRGDRVQVLYAPVDGPGQIDLLALRYHSTKNNQIYSAYRFKPAGSAYGRFFDAEGREIEERLKDSPIEQYEQITELMNLAGRRHHGIDFKTDVDTPIKAPYKTRILRVNWHTRRNGNCLNVAYPAKGYSAFFLHLDHVAEGIKPGKVVPAGTVIAYSGNTGRSTAPHLHYEMHDGRGRLVNPFDVHKSTRRKLEGADLTAFEKVRQDLDARLQRAAGGE